MIKFLIVEEFQPYFWKCSHPRYQHVKKDFNPLSSYKRSSFSPGSRRGKDKWILTLLVWKTSFVLQEWELFPSFLTLAGFPILIWDRSSRSVSSLPCCQPRSSAGNPCLCPPPGLRKKDTSASVPLSFFTPLCPCLQQDLKTVMEGYTQEFNHVNTCRVTLPKPEGLSSGS